MEHAGLRYRLYPDAAQERRLRRLAGCCRLVWNVALEQRLTALECYCRAGRPRNFVFPTYASQCRELKDLRNDAEVASWLAEAPMQVLQQTLRDLDRAWVGWLNGKNGRPRFKRKTNGGSFRDPQYVWAKRVSRRWAIVKLQRVGQVRFRHHRPVCGRVKHATVTLEPEGKWFVSLCVQRRSHEPKPRQLPPVGVDLGVVVPVALSTGELLGEAFRSLTTKEAERLRRLERNRERQRMGSKNREKTQMQINRLKARQRRRRANLIEQVSTQLAKNHSLAAFEQLSVRSMTRSARGTLENPGNNVRQKAGLNRALLDRSWGAIVTRSGQKLGRHGGTLIKVSAAYSSQTCPVCMIVDPESRVSRGLFVCTACGYAGHADISAARIILMRALGGDAHREFVPASPVERR